MPRKNICLALVFLLLLSDKKGCILLNLAVFYLDNSTLDQNLRELVYFSVSSPKVYCSTIYVKKMLPPSCKSSTSALKLLK